MAGKGSKKRPTQISKEEEDLRWKLAFASEEKKAEIKKQLDKFKAERLAKSHDKEN
jgi:hypothetical protein